MRTCERTRTQKKGGGVKRKNEGQIEEKCKTYWRFVNALKNLPVRFLYSKISKTIMTASCQ